MKKINNLVLLAASLQILESFFPHPIPGVRFGLANFIGVIALIYFNFSLAIQVAIFRTFVASIFLGSFLSVSFFLSFSAAVVSTFFMWFFYFLIKNLKVLKVSPVGISVVGAVSHNITQIFVVYFMFIKQKEIFYLLPILIIAALVSGSITGFLALSVLKRKEKLNLEEIPVMYESKETKKVKFLSIFNFFLHLIFFVLILVTKNNKILLILISFLALRIIVFRKVSLLINNLKKVLWIVFISVFIPVVFGRSGEVLANFWIFKITYDSVNLAILYTLRILGITFTSSSVMVFINKEDFLNILRKIFFFSSGVVDVMEGLIFDFPNFFEKVKSKLKEIKVKNLNSRFEDVAEIIINILESKY